MREKLVLLCKKKLHCPVEKLTLSGKKLHCHLRNAHCKSYYSYIEKCIMGIATSIIKVFAWSCQLQVAILGISMAIGVWAN